MAKAKTQKPKFIVCKVLMNLLMVEEFDRKTGEPIMVEKTDFDGKTKYTEVKTMTYKRGEEVALPEKIVKKLGPSVEIVMAPVVLEPLEEVEPETPKGELKPEKDGETVGDRIPKVDPK